MTSPIDKLIDAACFKRTPEGVETFHAYPCAHCGADGDSRGACCAAWVKIRCTGCDRQAVVARCEEDGNVEMVETDGCPNCSA